MVNKKDYYIKNRDRILEKKKEYYQKNKEELKKKMRIYGMRWYQDNKDKIQKLHREYYRNSIEKESGRHKRLYQKDKEIILKRSKEYYWENVNNIRKRHAEYNQRNKEKILEYKGAWQKIQRKVNPRYKLNENMGSAMARSLKGIKSGHPWQEFVNYSLNSLIKHLENKFDSKMSWDNYGSYWAVDHIKPKSLFSYNSKDDLEFKQCWALENLQPLEKIENIKKGNRYIN